MQIERALAEFCSRVSGLDVGPPRWYSIQDLRSKQSAAYTDWASHPGVYFFEQKGAVQYIGRALPRTGLRARVHNQCTAFGDPRWDRVIKDPATVVGVIVLPRAEWYWTAALEPFLIERCSPPHNRKVC
jgi:excinuclease UvrABC nuclease subunit